VITATEEHDLAGSTQGVKGGRIDESRERNRSIGETPLELKRFEVALCAGMGLKLGRNRGKNVVWCCPSLTLRVSIARWKSQRRNFKTDASGFYFSMETAKAQLQRAQAGVFFDSVHPRPTAT